MHSWWIKSQTIPLLQHAKWTPLFGNRSVRTGAANLLGSTFLWELCGYVLVESSLCSLSQECSALEAVLKLHDGQSLQVLHSQSVRTSCEKANCTRNTCVFAPACSLSACLSWQQWTLLDGSGRATQLLLDSSKTYRWSLEFVPSKLNQISC